MTTHTASTGAGGGRLARAFVGLLPFFLPAGCASRGPEPLRLTLISPHRDEIREEVALAFQDWFRERNLARADSLKRALVLSVDIFEVPSGKAIRLVPREEARRQVREFLADWRPDDLGDLYERLANWERTTALEAHPFFDSISELARSLDEWKQQIPPVEIVWQDIGGGTSQIARYVTAQYEAHPDGIGIDLLFGGGTDIYLRFADQGRLQKVDIPEPLRKRIRPQLNGVPLYDPGGRWYGPVLSSFGILCNREVLRRIGAPEPTRWADLGRPGLRGWVAAGDPRLTGSVHMVYEIVLQGQGWEKGFPLLLRLGANTHSFIRDSGSLARTVSTGEVAAAGNLDANALTAVGRDPEQIAFHLPEGETIINPDAMAVLRGAPRPQLARAFVEFALSDAGQLLFLLQPGQQGGPRRFPLCRLSVVEELYDRFPPAVRSVGDANPFRVKNTIPYNSKLGIGRWDALNDLIGAVIVDAHPELSAAWRAVRQSGLSEAEKQRLEAELFAPPCTEAELSAHARHAAEAGPRTRTATINRWGEEARQRYHAVLRRAQ